MIHYCEQCKKKYSSQQSLCNHNKKFHLKNNNINNIIINYNSNICELCNKKFVNKYTLKNHLLNNCYIKKFNNNESNLIKLELIKKETEQIKLEQIKEEKELLELKFKLKLKSSTNITNNIKNINNQLNSNNTNINTFKMYSIGKENLLEILSMIDKKTILNSRFGCLEKIVDIIHCKDYDQYKNILITNIKDEYAYKYCDILKKFICIKKNEVIRNLVDERLDNIREIYEELSETSKINESTKNLIKEFLDKMTNNDKYIETDEGVTYKNFRTYKEHRVKILIYNNMDKISKDLAIVLEQPINNIDV